MLKPHKNKNRKQSSTQWITRQLNDPFVKQAHKDGFRARSAYKLIEIHEKYKILANAPLVVDLGCAPGSWIQVLNKFCPANAHIIGVDLLAVEPCNATIIQGDFTTQEILDKVKNALNGQKCHGVVSDMAANTIGHSRTDAIRTAMLAEYAADFAINHLASGGFFVCKFFQGGADKNLLELLKRHFARVYHFKPTSSRPESPEVYGVALDFRG